ncbi:MAG: PilZ domain-containing protein [Desulfobacterales bacterium]|nr:PilZ domain-containing protein [Desulfobacterales bacterium]
MEKRSSKRALPTGFHGAEIKLTGVPLYQFKLKDISDNGASILIKENSAMINHLEVGQHLQIKFHANSHPDLNGYFESKIAHITKNEEGRYKGHYLVGVQILAK